MGEYRTVYAFQRSATSEPDIHIAETHKHYADNVVVTSKVSAFIFCVFCFSFWAGVKKFYLEVLLYTILAREKEIYTKELKLADDNDTLSSI